MMTHQQVLNITGWSKQALSQAVREHRVLRLVGDDGTHTYPLAAFGTDSPARPLPRVKEVLSVWAEADPRGWAAASWLVSPQTELSNATPPRDSRDGRTAGRSRGRPGAAGSSAACRVRAPRSGLHLTAPAPPNQLKDRFPTRMYPAGTVAFRSHAHGRRPWWFASTGAGRFDLAEPLGTCYLAESPVVTLLETWGGIQVVPSYMADARDASTLRINTPLQIVDLTSDKATQFGVTSEIFTTTDYGRSQLCAAALHNAGHDGIRYWARHDLAHTHACLALFDSAGDNRSRAPERYSIVRTDQLSARDDLLIELAQQTGIVVLPVPPLAPR